MEIFNSYNNYKKYEVGYDIWKAQKDRDYAKKMEYLKNNPVSEEERGQALQKGKVLLRTIDVMDEYSQSRAEDAEILVEQIGSEIISDAMLLGMAIGAVLMSKFKPKKPTVVNKNKNPFIPTDMIIPYAIGIMTSVVASIPVLAWAAQIQIGASRHGRFEAMREDLNDPRKFAVLDGNQQEQVDGIAKTMPVDEKMKKQLKKKDIDLNPFGFITTIKELMRNKKAYESEQGKFDERLRQDKDKFGLPLSQKDILDAKKDQQLLLNLVEKIDIASEEYCENVELATNTLNLFSGFGALGIGWCSSKIMKHIPAKSPMVAKVIPWALGITSALLVSVYSTSLQKQAARVGRFKIKKEMEQNPNNFVYVDDEKLKSQPDVPVQKTPAPNIFKFLWQVMQDHKEYKKYLKTGAIEEKKYQRALGKVELSPAQMQQAKALQHNTFKTFNKVDDNSQKYSESVEAVGQMIQGPIATVGTLLGMSIGGLVAAKRAKAKFAKMPKDSIKLEDIMAPSIVPVLMGSMMGAIPAVVTDYFITKKQKKASRVADMLAIKEMSDYREFVDYDKVQNASGNISTDDIKN